MYICICVSVFIYVCLSLGVCICRYGNILVCFPLTYAFPCFPFSFSCFSLFALFSHFRSGLRDHIENKAFLPVLSYPSYCWCYLYLSSIIFQLQLLNFNFWRVCLFVCFASLLRLTFRS